MGDLLDIDKRLGSLRQVRDLFPVAHHREHGEHENERRGGHDSRRGRYESLRAGLFVTGSLRCLGSRARFVEVLAQIGFGLEARPLGRVHRDEETRNGTTAVPQRLLSVAFWQIGLAHQVGRVIKSTWSVRYHTIVNGDRSVLVPLIFTDKRAGSSGVRARGTSSILEQDTTSHGVRLAGTRMHRNSKWKLTSRIRAKNDAV